MQTSGIGVMFRREISFNIQPMVPSPPATKIRQEDDRILLIKLSASFGPDELSSNIWMGFSTLRNTEITLSAVLSPDLLFAENGISGLMNNEWEEELNVTYQQQ